MCRGTFSDRTPTHPGVIFSGAGSTGVPAGGAYS